MKISRRAALKGLGTLITLPWLESIAEAAGSPNTHTPLRTLFIYVPNGVVIQSWKPKEIGPLTDLPPILRPLEPYKSYINVLSGLTLDKARANGDGPGDHARAMAAFLTGAQPRKTHGSDIRAGISADQHLAKTLGRATRFESLELGIEPGAQAGNCDSGYSCAYSSNLSWRGESTPNAKETDPQQLFERLFGRGKPDERAEARARRDADHRSVLDFVMEDARKLNTTLANADRRKLDEYLDSVRTVELRIRRLQEEIRADTPQPRPDLTVPNKTPKNFQEHCRIMCDLLVLAFQSDLTRVATFPFANDGSNRSYKQINVSEGHHELSHHGKNQEKLQKIEKINFHHMEQFAYLLQKLFEVKEPNGRSLLDNMLIVYGSGISDGDRHNHDDLPIILAGRAGCSVETGRHLAYPKETPLMNLYLAIFELMGAPAQRFGDSTGLLPI